MPVEAEKPLEATLTPPSPLTAAETRLEMRRAVCEDAAFRTAVDVATVEAWLAVLFAEQSA
jgi:hypothetical protein